MKLFLSRSVSTSLLLTSALLRPSTAAAFVHKTSSSSSFLARKMSTSLNSKPFSVVVQAEIDPSRMDEFLKMIENNAVQSRKEPNCQRFDVLRDQSDPNKFIFYEVYDSVEAIDHHKAQDHYKAWADFKESGGVISSASTKLDGEYMT